jgi:hypothetical protein
LNKSPTVWLLENEFLLLDNGLKKNAVIIDLVACLSLRGSSFNTRGIYQAIASAQLGKIGRADNWTPTASAASSFILRHII